MITEKPECYGNYDKCDVSCDMCPVKYNCFTVMVKHLHGNEKPVCFGNKDEENDICRICNFYHTCRKGIKKEKYKLTFPKRTGIESETIDKFRQHVDEQFTAYDMDVLTEINHIGAQKISTALSKIAGHPVIVTSTNVRIIRIEDVHEILSDTTKEYISVSFRLSGGVSGGAVLIFSKENVSRFVNLAFLKSGIRQENMKNINHEEAIKEISNILIGSYIAVMENTSQVNINWTAPTINRDANGAILEIMLSSEMKGALDTPIIDVEFGDESKWLNARFFVILHPDSLKTILAKFRGEV